jgi:hypothetical protein
MPGRPEVFRDFFHEAVDSPDLVRGSGTGNPPGNLSEEDNIMAEFLLSVWHDEDFDFDPDAPPSDDVQRLYDQVGAFNEEVQAAGAWVFAGGLQPRSSATVVRVDEGDVSMTDGPYAESKEQMGGFWVIDVPDLDTALEYARRGAAACEGPVEVRPFQG